MITRRMIRSVLLLATAAILAIPGGAHGSHALQAEHAQPPFALHAQDLHLRVPVTTSCAIAHCGYLQARVTYQTADGQWREITDEMLYQPAAVFTLTIPGEHVSGNNTYMPMNTLLYVIDVTQQDCLGPCHVEQVRLPRLGDPYVVMVVNAG